MHIKRSIFLVIPIVLSLVFFGLPSVFADVPDAPSLKSAIPFNGYVNLTWEAPDYDGGFPITSYTIEYKQKTGSSDKNGPWGTWVDLNSWKILQGNLTDTTFTARELVNNDRYWFRILAVNEEGTGPESNKKIQVPNTAPDKPTGVYVEYDKSVIGVGNGTDNDSIPIGDVTIHWVEPTYDGDTEFADDHNIVGYMISYKRDQVSTWTSYANVTESNRSHVLSGINATVADLYDFKVNAINDDPTSDTIGDSSSARTLPIIREHRPEIAFDIDFSSLNGTFNYILPLSNSTLGYECAIKSGTESLMFPELANYTSVYNGTRAEELNAVPITVLPCEGEFEISLERLVRADSYFTWYEWDQTMKKGDGSWVYGENYLQEIAFYYEADIFYDGESTLNDLVGYSSSGTDLIVVVQNAIVHHAHNTGQMTVLYSVANNSLPDVNDNNVWDELEDIVVIQYITPIISPSQTRFNIGQTMNLDCEIADGYADRHDYYIIIRDVDRNGIKTSHTNPFDFLAVPVLEDVIEVQCVMILKATNGAYSTASTASVFVTIPYGSTSDSNGCDDCIDPTFYYSQNTAIVKNGFKYNDYSTDVSISRHTETPILTSNTNQTNFLILKVYDNFGTGAVEWIDVGFSNPNQYHSLEDSEVVIQSKFSNGAYVDSFIEPRDQNLIDFGDVTASIVDCGYVSTDCIEIIIPHVFREHLLYPGMAISTWDESKNNKFHFINDGLEIQGEPLNESPTDRIFIQKYLGNPIPEWVSIERIDRVDDIWASEDGIEFKHLGGGGFQRTGPIGYENPIVD